jgi:dTDP-4-amino-4,6-dideoxygalactose transaminase
LAQLNEPNPLKLAIDGGTPSITQAPPAWPIANDEIRAAIDQAMADHTWGVYHGPWLDELNQQLSQYFGREHVVCCSSGTVAVELALRGTGAKPGDEVVLAGYDFPGNFRAIEAVGATPVLVDVIAGGWIMDFDAVKESLSEKTHSILISHLHGQVTNIPTLRETLNQLGRGDVQIIEDVCQAPGGRFDGQPLGALGDISVLSFGGSKLLSAGRGGAVLTNDSRIAQRVKIANDRGNEAYPLSQLQAIVLTPQIKALDDLNAKRTENALRLQTFTESLATLSGIQPQSSDVDIAPAFFKVPFQLNCEPWSRDQWLAAAQAEGLPMGTGFRGFLNRSERRCRKVGPLQNCKTAIEQTVLLHHPILLADDETIGQVEMTFQKLDSSIKAAADHE